MKSEREDFNKRESRVRKYLLRQQCCKINESLERKKKLLKNIIC